MLLSQERERVEQARREQEQRVAEQQLAEFERTRPGAARRRGKNRRGSSEQQPQRASALQRGAFFTFVPLLLACLAYFLYSLLAL